MNRAPIECAVSATIPAPREVVFAHMTTPDNLAEFLRPVGPVAGVRSATVHGAGVVSVGCRRRVITTRGAVLDHTITAHVPASAHGFQWRAGAGKPGPVLGRTRWDFVSEGDTTTVTWTCWLTPTAGLTWLPSPLRVVLLRRWMVAGLTAVRSRLHRGHVGQLTPPRRDHDRHNQQHDRSARRRPALSQR